MGCEWKEAALTSSRVGGSSSPMTSGTWEACCRPSESRDPPYPLEALHGSANLPEQTSLWTCLRTGRVLILAIVAAAVLAQARMSGLEAFQACCLHYGVQVASASGAIADRCTDDETASFALHHGIGVWTGGVEEAPAVLCDAGVGQLQEDFGAALQDVEQVRALVALPDQVLPVAEGALCQAGLQHLQQVVLQTPQGGFSSCQKAQGMR